MEQIIKIWFEDDTLFGLSDKGEILHQSLLWYPGLLKASDQDRSIYEFGLDGIHWRNLDEDVSFESFFMMMHTLRHYRDSFLSILKSTCLKLQTDSEKMLRC